ncbi:GNAT family N-acetyltransferase [Agromyces sp. NPDC056965]|uniref:GNAT family N-acetyltransferase n=1 Tax=Agromyces sp. NPDC056965 TaxID=3345983 RepID=UPI003633BFB9
MHENATPDPATTTPLDRAAAAAADGPPALRFPYDATALTETPISTERLVLRPLEASDAPDVFEYQRIPEVLRYIPWPERDRGEGYEATARRAAARVLAGDGDYFVLAMTLPDTPSVGDDDGPRVIGDIMVRVSSFANARLELGWIVHPDFQGRGYAYEAAAAVRDFAFDRLEPHRLEAYLDPRNTASAALCERLGMRHEGTMLEEAYNDEWQDSAVYGMLRRDWAASLT